MRRICAADFGAARLHGFNNFTALFTEESGEEAELRGFAAAVHAFESEEVAGMHRKFDFRTRADRKSAPPGSQPDLIRSALEYLSCCA